MPKEIQCRDCGVPISFLGQIKLVKQSDDFFWNLVVAVTTNNPTNLENYPVDIFRCSNCGRLEFYDLDLSLPEAPR